MTLIRGEKALLEHASRSTGTLLHAYHLAPGSMPSWDAEDDESRPVVIVGKAALEATPAGAEYVQEMLAALKTGEMLAGVCSVAFTPQASTHFVTATHSQAGDAVGRTLEVLGYGGRQGGKTIDKIAALGWLGEQRRRAGFRDPLIVMWVQDTLKSCREKTAASFEEPLWGGAWTVRANREEVVQTLGGVELVHVHFVGAADPASAEALRAASHVLVVDEAVPTLESGGVTQRQYEIALSSLLRLPGHRRVAIVGTNPGGTDSWCFTRWLGPDRRPECVAVEVNNAERLTAEELTALHQTFRYSPDLQARLARGEWADLILGPRVAMTFDPLVHVAKEPIPVMQTLDLYLGWDSGESHCHALVIGQRNGPRRLVLAALVMEDRDLKTFLRDAVVPWFAKHAPWALTLDGRWLIHRFDPSMNRESGLDASLSPLRLIKETVGLGHWDWGMTAWAEREGPMLMLLADTDGKGGPALQISPVEETRLLRQALAARWDYATTKGGQVVKDHGPRKPNRPWEDLGDAFAYWCGGVAGPVKKPKPKGWTPGRSKGYFHPLDPNFGHGSSAR